MGLPGVRHLCNSSKLVDMPAALSLVAKCKFLQHNPCLSVWLACRRHLKCWRRTQVCLTAPILCWLSLSAPQPIGAYGILTVGMFICVHDIYGTLFQVNSAAANNAMECWGGESMQVLMQHRPRSVMDLPRTCLIIIPTCINGLRMLHILHATLLYLSVSADTMPMTQHGHHSLFIVIAIVAVPVTHHRTATGATRLLTAAKHMAAACTQTHMQRLIQHSSTTTNRKQATGAPRRRGLPLAHTCTNARDR